MWFEHCLWHLNSLLDYISVNGYWWCTAGLMGLLWSDPISGEGAILFGTPCFRNWFKVTSLSPNIHTQILQTALHTFLLRIVERICFKITNLPLAVHFINTHYLFFWLCIGNIWTHNWPAPNISGFIAQLVEHRTGIARSRVQTPLKSWIFFRLLYAIA